MYNLCQDKILVTGQPRVYLPTYAYARRPGMFRRINRVRYEFSTMNIPKELSLTALGLCIDKSQLNKEATSLSNSVE